jgi:hypothetical protein
MELLRRYIPPLLPVARRHAKCLLTRLPVASIARGTSTLRVSVAGPFNPTKVSQSNTNLTQLHTIGL